MATPLISICIPAFRAEVFLPAALETVRNQTYPHWQLIVTEDGSRDSTESIVRSFAQGMSQPVIYNRHEKNKGLPATRNTGMAAAEGEWIAFIDSDDLWLPNHLEAMVAVADAKTDLVFSGCQIFEDKTGEDIEQRIATPEAMRTFDVSLYRGEIIIQPSAAMVRRTAAQAAGPFSLQCPICNDMEYWMRLASRGAVARYTGVITCRYRKHGGAMSTKSAALIAESGEICERYGTWEQIPAPLRRSRPADLYRNAAQILRKENPAQSRALLRKSLRLKPFSARSWALLAATYV